MFRRSSSLPLQFALFIFAILAPLCFAQADVSGRWTCDFLSGGGHYPQDFILVQNGTDVTGHEYYAGTNNAFANIIGTINGNHFVFTTPYISGSYTGHEDATVNGNSMSGTWYAGSPSSTDTFSCTFVGSGGNPTATPTIDPNDPRRPTALNLFCNRTGVLLEEADCSITLADAGPPPRTIPPGSVSFTSTNGFFPAAGSCNPQQTPYSPGIAACDVQLQIPNGFPLGAKFPINASYPGDANFRPSSTSHTLITAGCVGTPEHPCSGGVALSFGALPQIIKNIIAATATCGGATHGNSLFIPRSSLYCSMGMSALMQAQLLVNLGLDQVQLADIAKEIDKFDSDASLRALRSMFEKGSTNNDFFSKTFSDPDAFVDAFTKALKQQHEHKSLLIDSSDVLETRVLKRKKIVLINLGSAQVKVGNNKQHAVKIKLTPQARRLIKALHAGNVTTLTANFTLNSTRVGTVPHGVKRKVSVSQTLTVAF
jgi:hypothetical protein